MKKIFTFLTAGILLATSVLLSACGDSTDPGDFTSDEITMIRQALSADGTAFPKGTMRVLTIAEQSDSLILRDTCRMLSMEALLSEEYRELCSLMVATVTHPSQDGVGIAGPQVGLKRRVVAVQRFDKECAPFEVYPNIRIVWASDSLAYGPEGCLSVPDRRGDVLRSQEIVIEYSDLAAAKPANPMPLVRDTVRDFTAVIFQHETDHLDGVLYIDRL